MNQDRNFGASQVQDVNRYHLEGYANESSGEPAEIKSRLDVIFTESLDLPGECLAKSRIWRFKKDPWQFYSDSGQLLFSIEHIRFSLIHTADNDGGNRCNAILRFDWTSHGPCPGNENDPEIPMIVRAFGNAGASLMNWDLRKLKPGEDWIRRPVSFMQDVDPGIFELVGDIRWQLFVRRGRLYEC